MSNLEQDLQEVVSKVTGVLNRVQTAEPSLAEKVLEAVLNVLLSAGYTAPAEPATTATTTPTEGV